MNVVSGIVLYIVIWALCFFVAIPIRLQTQGEAGTTVEGTHSSSPETHHLRKKAVIVTIAAAVIWVAIATVILSGWITMDDIDWRK